MVLQSLKPFGQRGPCQYLAGVVLVLLVETERSPPCFLPRRLTFDSIRIAINN